MTWNGHGDALNLLEVSGTTLAVANSFAYDSWGTPTTHLHPGYGDLGFRFLYVGRAGVQWDAGLGLHLMGARHYSPALGRFLQPDPPALEENLYAYVANNPLTDTDPSGTYNPRRAKAGGGPGGPSAGRGGSSGGGGATTPNLRTIFRKGIWRGMCVQTAIRHALAAGFVNSSWANNMRGRTWSDGTGATVQIRYDRNRQWYLRIQNPRGTYLTERGYGQFGQSKTHIPLKRC